MVLLVHFRTRGFFLAYRKQKRTGVVMQSEAVIRAAINSDPTITDEQRERLLAAMKPKPADKPKTLLKRKAVASRADVHTETIKRWGRIGKLHPIRLSPRCVRYDPDEVEALIRNGVTV